MSVVPPGSHRPRIAHPAARQRTVTVLMLVALAVIAGKLVHIQAIAADEIALEALESRLVTTTIEPRRADIVDRNGVVMATSVDRYHVYANQASVATWTRTESGEVIAQGPLDAAAILAPILDLSEAELAATLTGDKSFVYVAKDVSIETWQLVRAEGIQGIGAEPTTQRLYPNENVGGNIVGFVGGDPERQGTNWGLAGVELAFEDYLLGQPGTMTYERGVGGTIIPTGIREEDPAVPGSTVVLTIDRDIQFMTQQILDQAVASTGASRGHVVITEVATGDILALVDSSPVNPANPGASEPHNRGSRAVQDVFEPGSTAKLITVAAALEEGLVHPESRFVAPYELTTDNGETYRDSHPHPDQKLTLAGVFVTSSNTGTIQAGEGLSLEQRWQYLQDFGLGRRTHVGLPGESPGIVHDWQKWDGRSRHAVLYGQSVAVTAVQTNQVYATIANGGVWTPTSVVKGFEAPDGTFEPRELGDPYRVVSEETAAELLTMLEMVTEVGTGRNAQIEGYRVGGKTGTAQAADGKGGLTSIVASFVGIAPIDEPRIVVSVILYDPQTSIWGSEVAAPVFRDVAAFTLQHLRVEPSSESGELFDTTWE